MKICYKCFHEMTDIARICPNCGAGAEISNAEQYPHALPCGSVLAGRYVTGRVLGQGGFGITYIAQEYNTKELVAIKEYYPDAMAIRDTASSVVPYNQERAFNYEYGKERFLEEAKTLAEFIGNPNIVRVNSYFEENGTAYFVMEYIKGISLKKYLAGKGGKISLEEALQILTPVMDALSAVHEKGIIHRDVTPDNIVITNEGNVKLLDFGAARYSIGERSQSLDIILKHGFAPYEQYIHRSRQGAFTDEYSLAATLYYAVSGTVPSDAMERLERDEIASLSDLGVNISPETEAVILKALSVKPDGRYRTMEEFKTALLTSLESCAVPGTGIPASHTEEQIRENTVESSDVQADRKEEAKTDYDYIPTAETENLTGEIVFEEKETPAEDKQKSFLQKNLLKLLILAVVVIVVIAFAFSKRGTGSGTIEGENVESNETAEEEDIRSEIEELKEKADQGDLEAQYVLAQKYANGDGVTQNYEEALAWYTKAAENGHIDAQYELGEIYHNGTVIAKDDEQAANWYTAAAEKGHPAAQYRIGTMCQSGEGVAQDESMAHTWFMKSAEQGYADAQYEVCLMYKAGNGVEQSDEEALAWAQKAADQGNAEGQLYVGGEYFNGNVVETDYDKAFYYITQAAEQGLYAAQNLLGFLYEKGFGTESDIEKAVFWYKKAAEQGHVQAQLMVASAYSSGQGVEQDKEEAVKWYRKAAEQGDPQGQYYLGSAYYNGEGVEKNDEEAFKWFLLSAEQDFDWAQRMVGYMYLFGYGVEKDYDKALEWLTKAADQGDGSAAYYIAVMYANGYGVTSDYEQTMDWLYKAYQNGSIAATLLYAQWHYEGSMGYSQNYETAFSLYMICAKAGNAEGQYYVAYMYENGLGTEEDLEEAEYWYKKSAEQSYEDAIIRLEEWGE